MALPPLTPQQRADALAKAAEARRERAAWKHRLKYGGLSVREVVEQARVNDILGKLKVVDMLESLPGVGPVKAAAAMDEIGISPSRRLRGLGDKQIEALRARFDGD